MMNHLKLAATLFFISFLANAEGTRTGGEVPFPFENANQKVELANDEYYILIGKIFWRDDRGYFEPDFEQHPWLASEYRRKTPRYPTISAPDAETVSREDFESLRNTEVKLLVRARSVNGAITLVLQEKPDIWIQSPGLGKLK